MTRPPTAASGKRTCGAEKSKLNDINHELAISRYTRTDPRRLHYLEQRKAQLLRDVQALGFTDAEIDANDVATGNPGHKEVGSKSYLVPLPSWMDSPDRKK
jgi:hypothetical protein